MRRTLQMTSSIQQQTGPLRRSVGGGVTGVHTDRTTSENVVKIGLVVSEISLLQAIVKIQRIGKKVTAALHKPAG